MMPGQSGRFDGIDVFYHPQNPSDWHHRRHAHRVGASVRVFYNRVRPRFLGLTLWELQHAGVSSSGQLGLPSLQPAEQAGGQRFCA